MKEYTVALTSITYAIKAQNALLARGIRARIARDERYTLGKSCGYALFIPISVSRVFVMDILKHENIKLAPPEPGSNY